MKEMDLILGRYADAKLSEFSDTELTDFEALLSASDPDLYSWVTGKEDAPEPFRAMVGRIQKFHKI